MNGSGAMSALAVRELVRQVRQPSRIVASVATPLMLWLFLVGGFSDAIGDVANGGASLTAYTIPGMASLTVMFASIFAAISLIQDRQDGMLRVALVSPAPRWSIILFALPFLGVQITPLGLVGSVLALLCISTALIGLGLAMAWIVDSTQGFHGVMNALLMPMWLLSGAVFPVEEAAGWMRFIALANPLTWAHAAMRWSLGMSDAFNPVLAWGICVAFALFGAGLGVWSIARSRHTR